MPVNDVVIVEAVRSPLGRRNGGLSSCHSIDVLGKVQVELFERSGVDPQEVGQVIGGCVGQVGMQTGSASAAPAPSAGTLPGPAGAFGSPPASKTSPKIGSIRATIEAEHNAYNGIARTTTSAQPV